MDHPLRILRVNRTWAFSSRQHSRTLPGRVPFYGDQPKMQLGLKKNGQLPTSLRVSWYFKNVMGLGMFEMGEQRSRKQGYLLLVGLDNQDQNMSRKQFSKSILNICGTFRNQWRPIKNVKMSMLENVEMGHPLPSTPVQPWNNWQHSALMIPGACVPQRNRRMANKPTFWG
jgi:hypothetical protein